MEFKINFCFRGQAVAPLRDTHGEYAADVVELLLKKGSNVEQRDKFVYHFNFDFLFKKNMIVYRRGRTPLLRSIRGVANDAFALLLA